MDVSWMAAARQHAEEEYPRESCGVLIDGQYRRCHNVASTPSEHFRIAGAEWAALLDEGEITAVIHSHPDHPPTPSEADLVACEETGLPWWIIGVDAGKAGPAKLVSPTGYRAPLVGREFAHGVLDCLTLLLDYYRRERGIELGNYERADGWWTRGESLYLRHLPAAGFREVVRGQPSGPELQEGDIILMQIRAAEPNHAGIYLADGTLSSEPGLWPQPGCILHHLYERLSTRDPYGGYWLEKTVGVWRYVGKD